jgi:hypothetical protein
MGKYNLKCLDSDHVHAASHILMYTVDDRVLLVHIKVNHIDPWLYLSYVAGTRESCRSGIATKMLR